MRRRRRSFVTPKINSTELSSQLQEYQKELSQLDMKIQNEKHKIASQFHDVLTAEKEYFPFGKPGGGAPNNRKSRRRRRMKKLADEERVVESPDENEVQRILSKNTNRRGGRVPSRRSYRDHQNDQRNYSDARMDPVPPRNYERNNQRMDYEPRGGRFDHQAIGYKPSYHGGRDNQGYQRRPSLQNQAPPPPIQTDTPNRRMSDVSYLSPKQKLYEDLPRNHYLVDHNPLNLQDDSHQSPKNAVYSPTKRTGNYTRLRFGLHDPNEVQECIEKRQKQIELKRMLEEQIAAKNERKKKEEEDRKRLIDVFYKDVDQWPEPKIVRRRNPNAPNGTYSTNDAAAGHSNDPKSNPNDDSHPPASSHASPARPKQQDPHLSTEPARGFESRVLEKSAVQESNETMKLPRIQRATSPPIISNHNHQETYHEPAEYMNNLKALRNDILNEQKSVNSMMGKLVRDLKKRKKNRFQSKQTEYQSFEIETPRDEVPQMKPGRSRKTFLNLQSVPTTPEEIFSEPSTPETTKHRKVPLDQSVDQSMKNDEFNHSRNFRNHGKNHGKGNKLDLSNRSKSVQKSPMRPSPIKPVALDESIDVGASLRGTSKFLFKEIEQEDTELLELPSKRKFLYPPSDEDEY